MKRDKIMIKKKLKSKKGFSLTELLVAIAIVALLSTILVTGVNLAMRSYAAVTDESNAQVLLSTCATMLRNELANARVIKTENNTVRYQRGDSNNVLTLKMADGEITVNDNQFISDVTATNDLHVSFDSITYADSQFTITNLAVKKGESKTLSSIDLLVIDNK